MKLKRLIQTAHHRNGVAGAPFDVMIFEDRGKQGSRKLGIVFDRQGHVAVLDIAKLCAGDIAFGSNSWRGDDYEPALRNVTSLQQPENDEPTSIAEQNMRRAMRLDAMLAGYDDEWPAGTVLIDLLTDAMHWCRRQDTAFHECIDQAYQHYANEVDAEQKIERRICS